MQQRTPVSRTSPSQTLPSRTVSPRTSAPRIAPVRILFWAVLLALLTLVPASVRAQAATAGAQSGLTEEDGDFYYYKKGKAVHSKWITVSTEDGKKRMYFGSDGKAYRAEKEPGYAFNLKVFKIGKARYGFDTNGYMVKGVCRSGGLDGQLYAFSKKGKYNAALTKKVRAAAKKGKSFPKLRKLIGKPLSTEKTTLCVEGFPAAVICTYESFTVTVLSSRKTVYQIDSIIDYGEYESF